MSINFFRSAFWPQVDSDRVSCDGYEVSRIIPGNGQGFLAERFIKPPVTITISFPFSIEIHLIVIYPTVGAQSSTGFEILTAQGVRSPASLEDCLGKEYKSDKSQETFMLVGKARIRHNDPVTPKFVFSKRSSYQRQINKTMFGSPKEVPVDGLHRTLHHRNRLYLEQVVGLTLRITATPTSCVPALKTLEVWGYPSSSSCPNLLREIRSLHNSLMSQKEFDFRQNSQKNATSTIQKNGGNMATEQDCKQQNIDVVPTEFLDEITCEIMTLPMLLPSGHTVDQKTVDKHTKEEEQWGRHPSDPFTGLRFTGKAFPVPNSSLKSRIDVFLLKNPELAIGVGRTVGRRNVSNIQEAFNSPSSEKTPLSRKHHETTSGCVTQATKELKPGTRHATESTRSGETSQFIQKKKSELLFDNTILKTMHSTSRLPGEENHSALSIDDQPPRFKNVCVSNSSIEVNKGSTTTISRNPNVVIKSKTDGKSDMCSSENCCSSLDTVLKTTLDSLPSFRPRKRLCTAVDFTVCSKCSAKSDTMYKLPCNHIICRLCVTKDKKDEPKQCGNCKLIFNTMDISRIHR